MLTTKLEDICLKDFLGARIELGDMFQAYRPKTTKKVTIGADVLLTTLPAAWFFGRLELNLEKGLVMHIKTIYYPNAAEDGDREITKVGWRQKISRTKFALLKVEQLIITTDLEAFFPYATKLGERSLRKMKLI